VALPAGIHYGCNIFPVQYYLDGLLMLSAIYIYERKTQSAFSILIGTFVKVYGIVGLSAFFLLKTNFGLFEFYNPCNPDFVLPMLISSPKFGIQSYLDWYTSLSGKILKIKP
jgi:hypothetical protein